MLVLDPLQKKGKGTDYGRLKASNEKKVIKKSKKIIPLMLVESQGELIDIEF